MSNLKEKNIVEQVREIREKQAAATFVKDYAYLQKQNPELYNKLLSELFLEEPIKKAA